MTFSQAIMQLLFDTKLVSSDLSAHNKMQRKGAPTFDQVEVAWHDALVVPGVVVLPGLGGELQSVGAVVEEERIPGPRLHHEPLEFQPDVLHVCNQIIHLHVV